MAEIENIRDWQGKDVLDSDGKKIGTVEDVHFDIETDEARFVCVKAGWLGHHVVLVPAAGVAPVRRRTATIGVPTAVSPFSSLRGRGYPAG